MPTPTKPSLTTVLTRQGSPIQIAIHSQHIAANILDFMFEAPSRDAMIQRRIDADLEERIATMIHHHIKDSIDKAHETTREDLRPKVELREV